MNAKSYFLGLCIIAGTLTFVSCGGDDDATEESGNNDPIPVADFEIMADESDPLLIHFTDASVNAETYAWDFGDGETSIEASPSHTYSVTGDHEVKLLITSGSLADSVTKTVSIESPGGVPVGANVVNGGDMSDPDAWTVTSGTTAGNVVSYEFTADGELHFSGDAELTTLHQLHIWQEIQLEADVEYLFSADVHGSGLDWGYLEVDLGTILPEDNAEYQHPNIDAVYGIDSVSSKVVGINNFVGCGLEAFEGNIIEVGCDGPALKPDPNNPDDAGTNGRIKVSYTGEYYLLLKAGVYDRTMGEGVFIDNILLAPIVQ